MSDPTDAMPDLSALGNAPWQAWLAAIAAAVFLVYRMLKEFRSADRNSDATFSAVDTYQQMSSELRAALGEMTKRADDFARERNEMAVQVARLEGQLEEVKRASEAADAKFSRLIELVTLQSQQMARLAEVVQNVATHKDAAP